MHLHNKITFIIALLLLALALALVLLPQSHRAGIPLNKKTNPAPDWFMDNAVAMKTDELGKVKGTVVSPTLTHYELNNVIVMKTPFFTLYDKNNVPWHIRAQIAHVYQGANERIELDSEVDVQQMPGPGSNQVHVTTDHLIYYPKTSLAVTQSFVTITEPGISMQSVGLIADLKQNTLKFLSKTQATYQDEEHNQNAPSHPVTP